LLVATVVLADTNVDVSVYAKGLASAGITNFTIIYVSDTQLDFTWGYGANTTQVMIRAKYGSYPADIADNATAPTDGYLVYYGGATSANDTSMDFDANPGPIYYRAWGWSPVFGWGLVPEEGSQEARIVTYIALFILALSLTIISIRWYNLLLSLFASVAWLFLWRYNLSTPLGDVAIGSIEQEWLTYLFIGMAIVIMMLFFWRRSRMSGSRGQTRGFDSAVPPEEEVGQGGRMSESVDEYRARIHAALHPPPRR